MVGVLIFLSYVAVFGVGVLTTWAVVSTRMRGSAYLQKAVEKARREGIAEGFIDGKNYRPGIEPPKP